MTLSTLRVLVQNEAAFFAAPASYIPFGYEGMDAQELEAFDHAIGFMYMVYELNNK